MRNAVELGLLKGEVPDEVEHRFRKKAMSRFGYARGAISKALEEAVRSWLRGEYRANEEEDENNKAYESMSRDLEEKYPGKYAAIAAGRLVAVADTLEEVMEKAEQEAGNVSHRVVLKLGEEAALRVKLGWRVQRKSAGHL